MLPGLSLRARISPIRGPVGYSAEVAWLRVGEPRGRTRIEPLDGDRTVVGRSISCEIRIDDPDAALRHVSILKTEHGFLLVNEVESLPIFRGQQAVNNHFMVRDVPYRVGGSTLVLTDQPQPAAEPPSATPTMAAPQPPPARTGATEPGTAPAPAQPVAAPVAETAADSWVWRRQDDSQAGSGPSIYSMGDGVPVVHASSKSWNWVEGRLPPAQLEPQIDLPADTPGPRSPPVPPAPGLDAPREPTPLRRPERPGVRPVRLRPSNAAEPPLPTVSKQLSSGHSWLWALPSSIRDRSDPDTTPGGGDRPLILSGAALILIGAILIGLSFALGLTPAAIAERFGGQL